MKRQRGALGRKTWHRRQFPYSAASIANTTINPALAHGIAEHVGSVPSKSPISSLVPGLLGFKPYGG